MTRKKPKLIKWDSAKYLKTEEDIAGFLEAAFEIGGDDPEYIAKVHRTITRARDLWSISVS